MNTVIVPAELAVQAMRDSGYKNAAYALAELMDNSIQAGAKHVELLCVEEDHLIDQRRRAHISSIAVLDDGGGMDADVLRIALQFGNGTHLHPEQQKGIGRFGMGLPNSSISQASRVDVWSWQAGVNSALHTYLDVKQIVRREQTSIPEPEQEPVPELWQRLGKAFGPTGTLVVWSRLDRIMWRTAQAVLDNSEYLIGRVYREFLHEGPTSIRLVSYNKDRDTTSERNARPNDPMYLMGNTSCPSPFDSTPMFQPWGDEAESTFDIAFRGETHRVKVRFSYAREDARQGINPGSTPYGQHAQKNIGVSIMRAKRELELDPSWAIQYDPVERWWGVEVDFPPALDELFGVTNNKQTARNFAELAKLNIDDLTKGGRSITEVMESLAAEGDPRAPLLEIAFHINTNLRTIRGLLRNQTRGARQGQRPRHTSTPAPEIIATQVTRDRQKEGYVGASDKDENLPAEQRTEIIARSLVTEGSMGEKAAQEMAAMTVSDNLKYRFIPAELSMPAFFTVSPRGGAIIIMLNTEHPAYSHLVEVLEENLDDADVSSLQARLARAADGLKLLLSAWARYEDEQRGQARTFAQDTRNDWGRMARRFLEREE